MYYASLGEVRASRGSATRSTPHIGQRSARRVYPPVAALADTPYALRYKPRSFAATSVAAPRERGRGALCAPLSYPTPDVLCDASAGEGYTSHGRHDATHVGRPCGLNSPRPRRFPPSTRAGNSALPPPPPEGAPPSTTRERKRLAASAPSAPRSASGWRRSSAAVAGRRACLAAVSLRLSVSPSLRAPFVRRSYVAIRREGALRSVVPSFLFRPCSSSRHDSLPLLPPPADCFSPCG